METRRHTMQNRRWLLPFTHTVDLHAIDTAMDLARQSAATLVALSLITPQRRGRHAPRVRLEQIQESKDFLEAVYWKALRHQIRVEYHELFTENILESILDQLDSRRCQGLLLITNGPNDAVLSSQEIASFGVNAPLALLVFIGTAAKHHGEKMGSLVAWVSCALTQRGEAKQG